jgi:hypothetical protein
MSSTSTTSDAGRFQDFLTPEAMLTPGVAGSLTMMIANALAVNFTAPRAWTGLVLSFVFGLLVLASTKSIWQKAVYYVLNSLVIFCVAVGANGFAVQSASQTAAYFSLTTSAFAQAPAKPGLEYCSNLSAAIAAAQKEGASNEKILELVRPCEAASQNIQKNGPSPTASPAQEKRFFAPWKF